MSVSLLKLALQRIGEDSICIIDGDDKTQVDSVEFAGNNNGMRRASKVFRGHSIYGEVELSLDNGSCHVVSSGLKSAYKSLPASVFIL